MKRANLTLFLFTIVYAQLFGQAVITNHAIGRSAFTDAENVVNDTTILQHYFANETEKQAFLTKYGFAVTDLPTMGGVAKFASMNSVQAGSDAAILSDPKMGIDALGTFIANRFKQEINITFLNKFRDDLNKIPNLDLLFPESKKILTQGDPYNYPVFMETLREAFAEDIDNMPRTLPKIISKVDPANVELAIQATILLRIVADPSTPSNFVTTLNDVALNLPTNASPDLKKGIYALAFTANALYKNDGADQAFITGKEDVFGTDDFREKFLALVIRQNELYLSTFTVQLDKISALINRLIPIYSALSKQVATLNSQNKQNKLTPQLMQESFGVLVKTVKDGVAAYKDSGLDPNFTSIKIDVIVLYGETINNVARLIIEKKYGLALVDVVAFIDGVSNTSRKQTP
jgi:hypothetical protein